MAIMPVGRAAVLLAVGQLPIALSVTTGLAAARITFLVLAAAFPVEEQSPIAPSAATRCPGVPPKGLVWAVVFMPLVQGSAIARSRALQSFAPCTHGHTPIA